MLLALKFVACVGTRINSLGSCGHTVNPLTSVTHIYGKICVICKNAKLNGCQIKIFEIYKFSAFIKHLLDYASSVSCWDIWAWSCESKIIKTPKSETQNSLIIKTSKEMDANLNGTSQGRCKAGKVTHVLLKHSHTAEILPKFWWQNCYCEGIGYSL